MFSDLKFIYIHRERGMLWKSQSSSWLDTIWDYDFDNYCKCHVKVRISNTIQAKSKLIEVDYII